MFPCRFTHVLVPYLHLRAPEAGARALPPRKNARKLVCTRAIISNEPRCLPLRSSRASPPRSSSGTPSPIRRSATSSPTASTLPAAAALSFRTTRGPTPPDSLPLGRTVLRCHCRCGCPSSRAGIDRRACSSTRPGSVGGNGDVLGSANPQVYAAPYLSHPYSSRE